MKVISILAAFAVVTTQTSLVKADPAKPTIGHTSTLIDTTVFIQGGSNTAGSATNAAYSIILGNGGTLKNSTFLDITTLAGFQPRDYHISIRAGALMLNCGTMDGPKGQMSCDTFNPIKYNTSELTVQSTTPPNRGGMAAAVSVVRQMTYIVGGSSEMGANMITSNITTDMSILTTGGLTWRSGTNLLQPLRFHTATWVDGAVNGVVVLGGQSPGGGINGFGTVYVFSSATSTWSTL
ncbi:hypothetical protein BGX28_010392, partial [Mortierella sp. GBA30]